MLGTFGSIATPKNKHSHNSEFTPENRPSPKGFEARNSSCLLRGKWRSTERGGHIACELCRDLPDVKPTVSGFLLTNKSTWKWRTACGPPLRMTSISLGAMICKSSTARLAGCLKELWLPSKPLLPAFPDSHGRKPTKAIFGTKAMMHQPGL